jgi:hypothetical protein
VARNLAGVLESGSRDHYRVREKREKKEEIIVDSPRPLSATEIG